MAELEPAVVKIGEYWKPFNSRVLEDPRVKVHTKDGRTLVLAAPAPFDVLISEPSNPWIAGIGSLFTRDFYMVARDRLRPNGIMCQWFNLYAVSEADMKMVVRSFYDVFPHGHLWQSSGGDLVLIGSKQPVMVDLKRIREAYQNTPEMQRHLFEGGIYHPDSLIGHFLMTREKSLEMAQAGPFNTDDCPLLEFSAPFSLYRTQEVYRNREILWKFAPSDFPPGLIPDEELRRRALFGAVNRDNYELVRSVLPQCRVNHPDTFVLSAALKLWEGGEAEIDAVREIYAACLRKFPGQSSFAASRWADLEYERHEFARAAELYAMALNKPGAGSSAYLTQMLGRCLFSLGEGARAIPALVRSAELNSHSSLALALAGAAAINLDDDKAARQFLRLALYRNSHDPLALKCMATVDYHDKKFQAAEQSLLEFLALCPDYPIMWLRLGDCRLAQGDRKGAKAAADQALKLAPDDPSVLEEVRRMPR